MIWSIYKHTSPSGKSYIGYTKQKPKDRWKGGNGYDKDTKFGKAIAKYGWDNFSHEIIETNIQSLEEAKQAEIAWIAYYDSYINGYNSTPGGDGIDPSMIKKVPVIQFNEQLQIVAEYESIKEASEKTGIFPTNIEAAAKKNGNQFRAGGFYWCRKEDYFENWKPRADLRSQPIICVETQIVYPSMEMAAIDNDINNAASISLCCIGNCITAGGLHWAYLKDYGPNWRPREPKEKDYSKVRKQVICYETGEIFESATAVAKLISAPVGNVTRACREHRKTRGLHYAYLEEFNEEWQPRPEYIPKGAPAKAVICLETGIQYESLRKASEELDITQSLISRCCTGEIQQTHNLHFRYKEN